MFGDNPELAVVKAYGFYALVGAARPLGFLTTFAVVNFALHRGRSLRVALALAFGAPVVIANETALYDVYLRDAFLDRVALPLKELLLGLLLGFIASLPFYAFKFAGGIVDSYRGESANGIVVQAAERETTIGAVFYFMILIAFLGADGFFRVFAMFYSTYRIWAIEQYLPPFGDAAIAVLVGELSRLFALMIRIGLPLLLMLFFTELFLMIASRLAAKFGLAGNSFLAKNLVALALLPIYAAYVFRTADTSIAEVWSAADILGAVFDERE